MRGGERLKSPQQYVEWCNLEHMPLIQLHSLTNLSPPLISHDKISVPKCRYFIVTASPRGKPRTQETLAISFQRTAQLRTLREAKSLPYGEESVVPYSGIVGIVGIVGVVGVVAGAVGAAGGWGIWKPRIFPLAEVSVTSPPMTLFL